MLLFFLILSSSFTNRRFKNLAKKARTNIKRARIQSSGPCLAPGHYDYNFVEFDLNVYLCDEMSDGIVSLAHDNKYAAIIQSRPAILPNATVYSDAARHSTFKVGDLIESDGNVGIYDFKKIGINEIFYSFTMGINNKELKCDKSTMQGRELTECDTYDFDFNWDKEKNAPYESVVGDLPEDYKHRIGGKGSVKISVDINFDSKKSWNAALDATFNDIKTTFGFSVPIGYKKNDAIELLSKYIDDDGFGDIKPSFSLNLKGIDIGFDLSMSSKLMMKHFNVNTPYEFDLYKKASANCRLVGKLMSFDAIFGRDNYYKTEVKNEFTNIATDEFYIIPKRIPKNPNKIKVEMNLSVSINLKLQFWIGNKDSKQEISLGPEIVNEVKYSMDKEKCSFPYLLENANKILMNFPFKIHSNSIVQT